MNDLVSSLLHLFGAAAAMTAAPRLLVRTRHDPLLLGGAVVHLFCLAFMLTFSGLFHLSEFALGAVPVSESFRRLDHIGIWLAMGGYFTLPHLLAFRGVWRWVPLGGVWTCALVGIAFKLMSFGKLPFLVNFGSYAAVSLMGVVSLFHMARLHGRGILRPIVQCYVVHGVAAAFFVFRPPDLVPGLWGAHEMWHLGVLIGAYAHARFLGVLLAHHEQEVPASEARPAPALEGAWAWLVPWG